MSLRGSVVGAMNTVFPSPLVMGDVFTDAQAVAPQVPPQAGPVSSLSVFLQNTTITYNVRNFRPAAPTVDDTQALHDCIAAAKAVNGTIDLGTGDLFFSSPLDFSDARNVTVRGFNGSWGGATGPQMSRLIYTGSGAGVGIKLASSYGVRFEGVRVCYNNAAFTGTLVATGASSSGADPQSFTARECAFEGLGVDSAATLIDVSKLITASITRCFFTGAGRAIACDKNLYANAITVKECQFFRTRFHPILNPGEGWTVAGNTFEPLVSLKAGAVEFDITSGRNVMAMDYRGNWHGDAAVAGNAWITGLRMLGGCIMANYFGNPVGATSYSIGLNGGQGCFIAGNRVEGFGAVCFEDGYTFRPTIVGNDFQVSNPIINPHFAIGETVLGNNGIAPPQITGSWGGNVAGKQLATALATIGLLDDQSTA